MQVLSQFIQRSIGLTLLLSLCFAVVSAQQQKTGAIRGQVVDELGGLILGATVVVADASGVEKTATTDAEGKYSISGLAPGRYTVRASAPNFALFEEQEIEVSAGRTETFDIKLDVTIEKQEVEVTREAAVSTEPENNAGAIVLRGADLESLPDDPDDLAAALQALAGPSAGPNGGQFYIDGFTGGRLPPKESIREIRINQNPFSAEYDRLGFGRVEIFTRPGTDKLRGQGFFIFSDESLNSRNPFASNRAPYQSRQFGGNLSGPIIAKKASFFLDLERREIDDNVIINALDPDNNFALINEAVVTPQRRLTFSPRFDYQINASNTLILRYSFLRTSAQNQGVGGFSLPERAYDTSNTQHTFQITETAVINQSIVNETRFQYTYENRKEDADSTVPVINVQEAFISGGPTIGLSSNPETRIELQNYTSWSVARHALKGGVRIRHTKIEDISPDNFNGTFTFASLEQYQNVLAGVPGATPAQFSIAGGNPEAGVSQTDFGLFFQDDWRVRPNLTLSLGLRYENQTNIDSNFNFAPRVSFAWSPGAGAASRPKTVVRGGFGMFYDRFAESLTLQANRFNGINQQQFIIRNPTFFPVVPTVEQLEATGFAQTVQTTRTVSETLQAPYTMQVAISVERQLPFGLTLSATYIRARTVHLLRSRNINSPLPGAGGVRPFGDVGNIYQYESSGFFNQSQLIIGANNRLGRSVTLFMNYRLNKAESDTDGAGTFPALPYDLSTELGRSAQDIRHNFFLGGNITLPWWDLRLNPLIFARSGSPFNITTGRDTNNDSLFTDRPAFATDLTRPGVVVTRFGAFDLIPLPGQEIIPRNFGHGPAFFSVNLGLSKTFSFGEVAGAANAAAQQGGGSGGGGGRAGGGGRGGRGGGGGASGRGGRAGGGGFNPFGGGGGAQGGGAAARAVTEKRYSLTVSLRAQNLFNRTNGGTPVGNLLSSFFGESVSTAGGFGFGPGGSSAAGNRRVEVQLRFSF